jgi:hypothetical protein
MTPLGGNIDQRRAKLIGSHLQFAAEVVRREHGGR